MKILLAHNYYQHRGGEDYVFEAEAKLLESKGHQVIQYIVHNDCISNKNVVKNAVSTIWNPKTFSDIRALIKNENVQIAHFHNTFPLISPSAYYAAQAEEVPVVQTIHNYRLLCPNALFYRNQRVCESCLGMAFPLPGVLHGCYRNNKAASAAVATMLAAHRITNTWKRTVSRYIALTNFAREKLITGGIPEERIVVKPNFISPDPGYCDTPENYALFVGRLSHEKGVTTLLDAWQYLGSLIPLKIAGEGSEDSQVRRAIKNFEGIEWLGYQPKSKIFSLMKKAAFLIFPSVWYEGLPTTVLESFAVGTPVIASKLGALTSLVVPGKNGFFFEAGNSQSLFEAVKEALMNPSLLLTMRKTARLTYEENFTANKNYALLTEIYENLAAKSK
jgi:glycosyltransferase involved in cell wall biosynthesis